MKVQLLQQFMLALGRLRVARRRMVAWLVVIFLGWTAARWGVLSALSSPEGGLSAEAMLRVQLVDVGLTLIAMAAAIGWVTQRGQAAARRVEKEGERLESAWSDARARIEREAQERIDAVETSRALLAKGVADAAESAENLAEDSDADTQRLASMILQLNDVASPVEAAAGSSSGLERFGLRQTIGASVERLREAGLSVTLSVDVDVPNAVRGDISRLSRLLEATVHHVTAAARTNAIFVQVGAHADASTVRTTIAVRESRTGNAADTDFVPHAPTSKPVLREMARRLGGAFDIGNTAADKLQATLHMPLRRSSAGALEEASGDWTPADDKRTEAPTASAMVSTVTPEALLSSTNVTEAETTVRVQHADVRAALADNAAKVTPPRGTPVMDSDARETLPGYDTAEDLTVDDAETGVWQKTTARVDRQPTKQIHPAESASASSIPVPPDEDATAPITKWTAESGWWSGAAELLESGDLMAVSGAASSWTVRDTQVVDAVDEARASQSSDRPLYAAPSSVIIEPTPRVERTDGSTPVVRGDEDVSNQPRILVVDDDPMARWSLTGQLSLFGFLVDAVSSGRQALSTVKKRHYDAVVLDNYMPDMNGFETAARMRSEEPERKVIIALSDMNSDAERSRCEAAGIDQMVHKPVSGEALAGVLNRWIGREDTTRATPNPQNFDGLDSDVMQRLEGIQIASEQPDLVERMIGAFIERAESAFHAFELGFDADDPKLMHVTAERLRRSCATLGATTMEEITTRVSEALQRGDLDEARPLITSLEAEFERVRPALLARA